MLRAVTQQGSCPSVSWAGGAAQAMAVRALPANVPARGQGLFDDKDAIFDVLTCEAIRPAGAASARVAGQELAAPKTDIKRIVVIADTGCRLKAAENDFQPCNDAVAWPFAQVAQSAALTKPDLVIHISDMHYRESPCPAGNAGCAGSPWGYGFDAWQADFFVPAKPLLAAAPWVFVRGNHEICSRAGQGWFRFTDAQPWQTGRSCDNPANDDDADFSNPYAVQIDPRTQFIVFDSAKASGKPYSYSDPAFAKYKSNMQAADVLAAQKPHNFFMSHHPLLAVASGKKAKTQCLAAPKACNRCSAPRVRSACLPRRLMWPCTATFMCLKRWRSSQPARRRWCWATLARPTMATCPPDCRQTLRSTPAR